MGLNDTAEQLAACQADTVRLEQALARIARIAEQRLRTEHSSVTDATYWSDVRRIVEDASYGRPQGVTLSPREVSTVYFLIGSHEGGSGKPAHGNVLELLAILDAS